MQSSIIKKSLVIGIILLFIGVGVLSNASSTSISSSNKQILEYENEPEDDQTEIITIINEYIHGDAYLNMSNYDILFYSGWLEINGYEKFTIKGLNKPIFPLSESIFNIKVRDVYAPHFYGIVISNPGEHSIHGIAIGNIKWE